MKKTSINWHNRSNNYYFCTYTEPKEKKIWHNTYKPKGKLYEAQKPDTEFKHQLDNIKKYKDTSSLCQEKQHLVQFTCQQVFTTLTQSLFDKIKKYKNLNHWLYAANSIRQMHFPQQCLQHVKMHV